MVFVDVHANPKDTSLEELWYTWEKEAKATLETKEAGKVVPA